jgi:hypothetical protein
MDMVSLGSTDITYDMDHLEQYVDLERELFMYTTALNQVEATYTVDQSVLNIFTKTTQVVTRILNLFEKAFDLDVRTKKAMEKALDMITSVLRRSIELTLSTDYTSMAMLQRTFTLDSLALKTRDAIYIASVTLV